MQQNPFELKAVQQEESGGCAAKLQFIKNIIAYIITFFQPKPSPATFLSWLKL